VKNSPQQVDVAAGLNIRDRRRRLKMTQDQLGELVGHSNITIWKYENGRNCMTLSTFVAIAAALSTTPQRLLRPRQSEK